MPESIVFYGPRDPTASWGDSYALDDLQVGSGPAIVYDTDAAGAAIRTLVTTVQRDNPVPLRGAIWEDNRLCEASLPPGVRYDARVTYYTLPSVAVPESRAFACYHCALWYAGSAELIYAATANCPWPPARLEGLFPETRGETAVPGTGTTKNVPFDTLPTRACGNCGRVGHNSRTCEAAPKAIKAIGIEIEGRWEQLAIKQRQAREDGLDGSHDGSIEESDTAEGYEFKTVPGGLPQALQQLVKFYPDEADRSCGMHVHLSFVSQVDIALLCSEAFFDYFRVRWREWGTRMGILETSAFWSRLNGGNSYCRINTAGNSGRNMDRYHQLNFSCWMPSRPTMECRLLPMFRKQSLGVAAVQELVDIVETFLATKVDDVVNRAEVPLDTPAPIEITTEVELLDVLAANMTAEVDVPADPEPLAPDTIRYRLGQIQEGRVYVTDDVTNRVNQMVPQN